MPERKQRLFEETLQGEDEVLQRAAEAEEGVGQEAVGSVGLRFIRQLSRLGHLAFFLILGKTLGKSKGRGVILEN